MRRSSRLTVGLAGAAVFLAACGTRLPNSAFPELNPGGVALPGASAGPSATATVPGAVGPSRGALVPGAPGTSGVPGLTATGGPGRGSGRAPGGIPDYASDIGVSANTIDIGIIASKTNPFDPNAFTGPEAGAITFFENLDAHGGVDGRDVVWHTCDDQGQGSENQACVSQLIGTDKIFALNATAVLSYAGAAYVNSHGVPDIGGQPVDTSFDTYRHLYSIYGSDEPRNDTTPGFHGYLYNGTEQYRYFHLEYDTHVAGVVYYNQADSQRFAGAIEDGLKAEGYQVYPERINFALPDYDSAVLDMASHHVDIVFDTLDRGGNENLCRSMDQNHLYVKAKVTTTQGWVDSIRQDFSDAPHCRNTIFAAGTSRNFEDTQYPEVAAFRAAAARFHEDNPELMSEWEYEGWLSAQWLTDAIASCGANLTRRCVEAYMNRPVDYDAHGGFSSANRNFIRRTRAPSMIFDCVNIARWEDSADGGLGGWITQPAIGQPRKGFSCFTVHYVPYPAS